jgi:orotidine-5'-phosphate decarboxylase
MNTGQLFSHLRAKKSFLCIGLDSDVSKIPPHLSSGEDPVFAFNKEIIDATADLAIAYKPNLAFYECQGIQGWASLTKTVTYLREHYPDLFLIADAKRGDIGNTSSKYAAAFFDKKTSGLDFDAVTVAPYMGVDSVTPFLEYEGKWVILLALTSNKGADDFQLMTMGDSSARLFEKVIIQSMQWAGPDRMMYVIGATKATMLKDIRKLAPDHFLLVPGIGAQGGSLQEVASYGLNKQCGLIVNSSRAILFADSTPAFAVKAREAALQVQKEMQVILEEHKLL